MKILEHFLKVEEMMTVMSCAGKHCFIYSCFTLPTTDFHELLPRSQYSYLTTRTLCNTYHLMAGQEAVFKVFICL